MRNIAKQFGKGGKQGCITLLLFIQSLFKIYIEEAELEGYDEVLLLWLFFSEICHILCANAQPWEWG